MMKEYLTRKEVVKRYRISMSSVIRLQQAKRLNAMRFPKDSRTYYSVYEVNALLRADLKRKNQLNDTTK